MLLHTVQDMLGADYAHMLQIATNTGREKSHHVLQSLLHVNSWCIY